MNQLSPFFIEQGIPAITVRFLRICGHRIQLQPHMAEQCRQPTKSDAVLPESCMAAAMANMRPHHLGREKVTHATLYGAALRGSIIVSCPDPVCALQDSDVITPPTGSTGLKLNMWKTFTEEIKQSIELTGLCICCRTAFMPCLYKLTIHVPFHIINRMFSQ